MVIASNRRWQFVQQRTPAPICSETRLIRPWGNSLATRPIAAVTGYARMLTVWVAELFVPVPVLSPAVALLSLASRRSSIDRLGA